MARAKTDLKAKEKKQKIVLAAGGVLLLALLAIQGPKLMKQLKGPSAPAAAATPATTTTTTSTAATATSSGLQDTGGAQLAGVETLTSFTRFHAKDPFEPQATETVPSGGTAAPQTTPAKKPAKKPPAKPKPTVPATGPVFGTVELPAEKPSGDDKQAPGLPQAVLRVNGKKAEVPLGQSFPEGSPVFRLAGFAPGSVKIAIVGGSLADGSETLTLKRKHAVTLVNTADGTRYELELLTTSRTAS
jgi:hypothetical protein